MSSASPGRLGKYLVAGDYILLGAIVTIVVVLVAMLEVGNRAGAPVATRATAPAAKPTAQPAASAVSASST